MRYNKGPIVLPSKTKGEIKTDLEDCPVDLTETDVDCLAEWIYNLLLKEVKLEQEKWDGKGWWQ